MVEQIQKKFPELKEVYAVQESWLAKLGHWDEALVKYNQKLVATPYDSAVLAGKMKCLDALGRWEEAIQVIYLCLFALIIVSTLPARPFAQKRRSILSTSLTPVLNFILPLDVRGQFGIDACGV